MKLLYYILPLFNDLIFKSSLAYAIFVAFDKYIFNDGYDIWAVPLTSDDGKSAQERLLKGDVNILLLIQLNSNENMVWMETLFGRTGGTASTLQGNIHIHRLAHDNGTDLGAIYTVVILGEMKS